MTPALMILIPAAGASTRMRGRDKLLETVDGMPLLRRQVVMALGSGFPVLVTLPADGAARAESLKDLPADKLTLLSIADAAEGLSASLRAGARVALRDGSAGMMIVLPDLPELTTDDLSAIAQSFAEAPDAILRATDDRGNPGHPVVLPRQHLAEVAALRGDTGARDLMRRYKPRTYALPGRRATGDLDTPEAWAAWRKDGPAN